VTAIAHPADAAPEDEFPSAEEVQPPGSVSRRGVRLILRFVRLHPVPFAASLVGGVGWAALVVAASFVLGRVTDDVIEPGFEPGGVPASTVWWAVAALFLVGVLRGLSVAVRRWFGSVTEARMQRTVRTSVVDRLLTMPLSSYRRRPTGELLANADVDVTTATQMLMPLPFSLGVIALVVISIISLLSADPAFAVVALLLFPALAALSRYYTNKVHEPSARVQARLGDVSSIAHESFDGALVVKTLGRERQEEARFSAAADRLRTERLGVARMTAVFEPMIDLLPNLGMVVLLLVGAWRIDTGGATPGDLVQAVALFGWLAFPMRIVGFLFEAIPRAVVSMERVDALTDEPVDDAVEGTGAATGHLPDGPLPLEVRDVSFAYGDATVLDGVTFEVDPGEVVALVGSTGSGKSTLTNLLVRLDEPTGGRILLGGVPVDELDPAELRAAVSVAFQESYLFASPVVDNVTLGRDVPADDVRDALDRARAARFVARLPQAERTIVGERGVTLSGGQRQRVALARALARQPRVLLLDDATSAVDPVIEAEILAGLRQGSTTMVVVAHRLSTILLADRVVHLSDGRVRGVGTHAELLADPEYAALVTAYEAEEQADHDAHFDDDPDDVEDPSSLDSRPGGAV
jgi:ABC-type multidrug transport system fused ATPase/permease subunit